MQCCQRVAYALLHREEESVKMLNIKLNTDLKFYVYSSNMPEAKLFEYGTDEAKCTLKNSENAFVKSTSRVISKIADLVF